MTKRSSLAVASRLAEMKNRVAERARAELARHEAEIRRVEKSILQLENRRESAIELTRPDEGQLLDPRDALAGRWSQLSIDRAIRVARTDLNKRNTQKTSVEAEARKLSVDAERADTMHSILDGEDREERKKVETKRLDELAVESIYRRKIYR